jgi:hypothetical protein
VIINCNRCYAAIPDDMVFCLNCGNRLRDEEQETVIRDAPKFAIVDDDIESSPWPSGRAMLLFAALLLISGIGFYVLVRGTGVFPFLGGTTATNSNVNIAQSFPSSTPVSTPTAAPATPTPAPTRKRTPKPTPTPIDIDEMRAEYDGRESANANAMATASNYSRGNVANVPANIAGSYYVPPPYDANGKPLRAICRDGGPSYWQYDRWATCLTRGGVKRWIRP